MKNYDSRLHALQEKLIRKAKIESMLKDLRSQLSGLRAEEQRLEQIYRKERSDVDRLEQASLASLFYTVLSKKEEKLDKEKAEAYAAAIKRDAAARQVQSAQQEIESLEAELSGLSGVQAQYDAAFAEKAAEIKAENRTNGAEIIKIEERLGYIAAQQREIDEAVSAGASILSQIRSIGSELSSAESWGTVDLFGGGLISDVVKHSHLDEAQARINYLQELLRRYRTELADITIHADIQAQVDGFLRFADYFFDGLFADWAVLDSIRSSQAQVASTRSQVEDVQRQLAGMSDALFSEADALTRRLQEIVLNA